MSIRIDKKGKITIPKYYRDKFNLNHKILLRFYCDQSGMRLEPEKVCATCGKALPEELYKRGACAECPEAPNRITIIY